MAPPSPRRSSRARASNPQSQQSSVSSGASGRHERNTRSVTKPSSNKSTPSLSLSSESLEDLDDTLLGRRRKRGLDEETDKSSRPDIFDMTTGSEDLQDEEDEAVRCICGAEEYPGRPPVEGPDAEYFAAIELTEDVTGFFVQCDICKVWQHGACVGIFSAESSPDEYFCEQCRKDFHKVHTATNGQKYTKYLPIHRPSRAASRATSIAKENVRSPKNGASKNTKPTANSQASKRRSTMNSRDRAYEDEQLLRAIEASKEDAPPEVVENVSRRNKRGRSDSEESVAVTSQQSDDKLISSRNPPSVKRQRTSSQSASPPTEPIETPSAGESDGEPNGRSASKKARNGKPQREKTEKVEKSDKAEKEEKERQRQDAVNKRKGRADRRRLEASESPEEIPATVKAPVLKVEEPPAEPEPPAVPQPAPDTPPTSHPPTGGSHKRGTRNVHKKGKGRNQHNKELDGETSESPARSMSRDILKNGDEAPTSAHSKPSSTDHRQGSKHKIALPHRLNMVDMKRRVGAIMDFISRTQVDLAAEEYPMFNGDFSSGLTSPQKTPAHHANGSSEALSSADEKESTPEASHMKDFKELNPMEMMDVLTRDMVKWQNQYA